MHGTPQVRRTNTLPGSRPPTIDHWRIGQFIGQACGHPGCGAMELVASAYAGLGSAPARTTYWLDDLLPADRSEEYTSELQSLMRISYAVFCLKKKTNHKTESTTHMHKNNALDN